MASDNDIDLDELIPAGDPSKFKPETCADDWTRDERRMVQIGALAISSDPNLSLEEKLELTIALILKPLRREPN